MSSDIVLQQGINTGLGWILEPPFDLTNLTFLCQVRAYEDPNAPLLAEFPVTVQVINTDTVVCATWTATESLQWCWNEGYMDIVVIDNGVPRQILDQAHVIVDKVVSHE